VIIPPPPRPHNTNIHRKKKDRDAREDYADYSSGWESVVAPVVPVGVWATPAREEVWHCAEVGTFRREEAGKDEGEVT
jgi:hypothetical protein